MIKFEESTHRYITEEGLDLISVSRFMDRFKEKVDWNKIAMNSAKKESKLTGLKVTAEDIRKKWDRKRDISCTIGTLLHSIKEQELPEYENGLNKQECIFEDGMKYSIPINKLENDTVYPELMIYNLDYGICGQSDKVIVKNNTIHIYDYKTDAKLDFKAFSNKWVKPRKLLPPVDHLDDCNTNIYSLKMSMYMYLLWLSNKGSLKAGDIVIEHIELKRDEDGIPVLENGLPVELSSKTIKLPYRKKEVIAMLKTLK